MDGFWDVRGLGAPFLSYVRDARRWSRVVASSSMAGLLEAHMHVLSSYFSLPVGVFDQLVRTHTGFKRMRFVVYVGALPIPFVVLGN